MIIASARRCASRSSGAPKRLDEPRASPDDGHNLQAYISIICKLSEENATSLIMRARVKAGWIDESDLLVPEEDKKEEVPTASSEPTAEDVFG